MQGVEEILERALIEVVQADDLEHLDPDGLLHEQLDLDSVDFLRLVEAVGERARIEIPARDYPRFCSLSSARAYLEERLGQAHKPSPARR